MTDRYDSKGKPHSFLDEVFSLHSGGKPNVPERLSRLGIPEEELTESVTLAVSALLERLDDTRRELALSHEKLAEIESLVDVDCVAHIPNRRAFMRRLAWVISMRQRYGHPSSIVYFDLNGFKAINDNFGHAAGDIAIRHVAELLLKAKRESDFMARIGGDEFAIIMYYANEEDAIRRAHSIAETIRSTPFRYNDKPLQVDSAVGVHAIRQGETPEEALHQADMQMYRNKQVGRMAEAELNA